VLDQLCLVEENRLVTRLDTIDPVTADQVLESLAKMIARLIAKGRSRCLGRLVHQVLDFGREQTGHAFFQRAKRLMYRKL
jgi:hypothetical protein